jgi:hypothetical protein
VRVGSICLIVYLAFTFCTRVWVRSRTISVACMLRFGSTRHSQTEYVHLLQWSQQMHCADVYEKLTFGASKPGFPALILTNIVSALWHVRSACCSSSEIINVLQRRCAHATLKSCRTRMCALLTAFSMQGLEPTYALLFLTGAALTEASRCACSR